MFTRIVLQKLMSMISGPGEIFYLHQKLIGEVGNIYVCYFVTQEGTERDHFPVLSVIYQIEHTTRLESRFAHSRDHHFAIIAEDN